MNRNLSGGILLTLLLFMTVNSHAAVVDDLQQEYQAEAGQAFSASSAKTLWNRAFPSPKGDADRSCGSCHGKDLVDAGKHARTGKRIEPLAPSVNPERLTDAKHIRKWLKRNCKWVMGRECSAQEKGDFLEYIRQQ